MDWKPISSAPFERDLELAVINYDGEHGHRTDLDVPSRPGQMFRLRPGQLFRLQTGPARNFQSLPMFYAAYPSQWVPVLADAEA